MIKFLLNLFFENTCKYCGKDFTPKEQGYICPECISEIKKYELFEDLPEIEWVDGYEFFAKYEGVAREVILLYKFQSVKPFALTIAEKIREDFRKFVEEVRPDLITYVPVHILRWWTRGYDHNREVLKRLGLPFKKLLRRVKYSRPLAQYGKEKREEVLKSAYSVISPKDIFGKRILVYDDILTTGSTAREVAKVLKRAGASEVYFYFFLKES